jgi:predicted amidohydrolase
MSKQLPAGHWQLSALQLCSAALPADNLKLISDLLQQLPPQRPQLVALPEGALCFGAPDGTNLTIAEPLGQGPLQQALAALAQQHQVYLLVGTLPTLPAAAECPAQAGKTKRFAASSLLFGPDGTLLADYQKLHLFDADVSDNTARYRESDSTQPGDKITVLTLPARQVCPADDSAAAPGAPPALKIGLSICYDVRFAGLYQRMRQEGANLICVPAAFTTVTGAAHWHTLLRARAIETQSYVLAPAQTGTHQNGRQTYGHSLIIDPWGNVLADAGTESGLVSVTIDLTEVARIRQQMPLATHNRFGSDWL